MPSGNANMNQIDFLKRFSRIQTCRPLASYMEPCGGEI